MHPSGVASLLSGWVTILGDMLDHATRTRRPKHALCSDGHDDDDDDDDVDNDNKNKNNKNKNNIT